MLLKFKVKNYKSFAEEAIFDMCSVSDEDTLAYSIMSEKCGQDEVKVLPTSVIYGPNASGKTNIIGAMEAIREIIKRGHIRNAEYASTPNQAAYKLELIPNCHARKKLPCEFEIEFCEMGYKISYAISLDLGTFLDTGYESRRKVLFESLNVNNTLVFKREKKNVTIYDLLPISDYLSASEWWKKHNNTVITSDEQDLFLENAFRINFAPEFVKLINRWLAEKFYVLPSVNIMETSSVGNKGGLYVEEYSNKAAKMFGLCSDKIGYYKEGEKNMPRMYSVYKKSNKDNGVLIPSNIFESFGTTRLVNVFPALHHAFVTGATLVMDELDASLHPMAVMSIISAFHNDNINKKHAQLIFNTHNPVFLNANVFRKDEIKFVEKNDQGSVLYSLADFVTSEEKKGHEAGDYMKNYFVSRYGAIKDIDFSPLFEEMVNKTLKRDGKNA